jgi:hypothetical protein
LERQAGLLRTKPHEGNRAAKDKRSKDFGTMTETDFKNLTQLGRQGAAPASPEEATLETVPNDQQGSPYVVRFTCPEFTSICPVTGQPDFSRGAPMWCVSPVRSLRRFARSPGSRILPTW